MGKKWRQNGVFAHNSLTKHTRGLKFGIEVVSRSICSQNKFQLSSCFGSGVILEKRFGHLIVD